MRAWPSKPAATLLHLGPGLANGLANLHNARRARLADRQHRRRPRHLPSQARRAAHHRHRGARAAHVALGQALGRRRRRVARRRRQRWRPPSTPPGQIATLILPADAAWDEAQAHRAGRGRLPARRRVEADARRPRGRSGAALRRCRPSCCSAGDGAARQGARDRRPHRAGHRRADHGAAVERARRARRRPRGHRPRALRGRSGARAAARTPPAHPGRRQGAGRVLRLSRQAEPSCRPNDAEMLELARPGDDLASALDCARRRARRARMSTQPLLRQRVRPDLPGGT